MAVEIPSSRARESNMLLLENLALNKEMFSEQQAIFCQPVPASTSGKRVGLMDIAFSQSLFQLCHNPRCFGPNLTVSYITDTTGCPKKRTLRIANIPNHQLI